MARTEDPMKWVIPGLFTNNYGHKKPDPVYLHIVFEKQYFRFWFDYGGTRQSIWIDRKHLMKCNYDMMILEGLKPFEKT
jgi:hypothetical protein